MARHTLFAYVEGFDLIDISDELQTAFGAFVDGRHWICSQVLVVNQRHELAENATPGDLPIWNLGLNFGLPDPGKETPGWFGDVELTAQFLATLNDRTGRSFVIGIHDSLGGFSEDLFFVQSKDVDLRLLRRVIGVGEID